MSDQIKKKIAGIITNGPRIQKSNEPILNLITENTAYDTKVFWRGKLVSGITEISLTYNAYGTIPSLKIIGALASPSYSKFLEEIRSYTEMTHLRVKINGGKPIAVHFNIDGVSSDDMLRGVGTGTTYDPYTPYTPQYWDSTRYYTTSGWTPGPMWSTTYDTIKIGT